MSKRFISFNTSLFLVELVFVIEVTACVVIAPSAVKSLHLDPSLSGLIVNSYLYVAFASLVIFLALRKWIVRILSAGRCLYWGAWIFVIGNLACLQAASIELFLIGRVIQGFGGAMAMVGELWSASEVYNKKITVALFWAECGSAIGIVIGPAMGGFIAGLGTGTWRILFIINAAIGATSAVTAWYALRVESIATSPALIKKFRITEWFMWLILVQAAVAALAIGAEFLMSDYLQVRIHKSPNFVGYMATLASIGAIAGSWIMLIINRSFTKYAQNALYTMIAMHILMVFLIMNNYINLSSVPIFGVGMCLGIANVAIYAEISKKVGQDFFLPATLIYLVAVLAGNALGIEMVALTEGRGWSLSHAEFVMVIAPLIPLGAMMLWRLRFPKTDYAAP